MNYQDIIQVLYITLLTELFIILAYTIAIIIDFKNYIDKIKLTLDKFQSVSDKALDIVDDIEVKIKKIINFADLLGEVTNIINSVIFGKSGLSNQSSFGSKKEEKNLDDELNLSKDNRKKIIRKRII